jgi:hypothetical protein
MCSDDCPADKYCTADCYCEDKQEISCSENTEDAEQRGTNLFSDVMFRCGDDCPIRYGCNDACICEEIICPEPIWTDNYFHPPAIDGDFEELMEIALQDPWIFFDYFGDSMDVSGYFHTRDGEIYFIPFYEVQLTLRPNPKNEYITKDGWEAWCVNDFYEGEEALDIDLNWLDKPIETCEWGGRESYEGVITVCTEIMIEWFEYFIETY